MGSEFREIETKTKLKDCQGIKVTSYQHQGNYNTGDKVWYQYKDGNAWYGPAEVIYHKGNTIFVYGNGDIKKVAARKVKPYNLKEREDEPREDGEKSPETVGRENNSEDDDN